MLALLGAVLALPLGWLPVTAVLLGDAHDGWEDPGWLGSVSSRLHLPGWEAVPILLLPPCWSPCCGPRSRRLGRCQRGPAEPGPPRPDPPGPHSRRPENPGCARAPDARQRLGLQLGSIGEELEVELADLDGGALQHGTGLGQGSVDAEPA